MRRLEARWGSPDFSAGELERDGNAFQVRKARVGGFREELAPETVARLGERLREELIDSGGYDL